MKYESISIKRAVEMIDDKKLLLPHIQRPFVWKYEQVKSFFDSIMREYPINTLLFWRTKEDVQIRRFIDSYHEGINIKETYLKSSEYQNKEKLLVLDGQQRLQALYIALKGNYEDNELYFDILSGRTPIIEGKNELKYLVEYMTKEQANQENAENKTHYWILLKDIVLSDESSTEIKRSILKKINRTEEEKQQIEEIIEDNVAKIKKLFAENDLIFYYPIDSVSKRYTYDEVLEIFVRSNSGGTILSKSDLMFSLIKLNWETAEEDFEDLLNSLNRQGAFIFDKDFILKTALVWSGKGAKYEVAKFKGPEGEKTLEYIRSDWENLEKSFLWLQDFLDYARITSDEVLPSYNSLIPIVYFAGVHDCKTASPKVKHNMQTWLYKVLLNGNFSGQADRAIDNSAEVIYDESTVDYFPYRELEETMRKLRRKVDVDSLIIDSNHYLVLNIVYLFNNQILNFQPKLNGNTPEIDHIFPKSKMTYTYKQPSSLVNNIGNYMFLEKTLNIQKTNRMPEDYFPEAIAEQPDFFRRNLIPTNPELHKPENFSEFVNTRREMIFNIIRNVLVYRD
ncbi:MAG: DUF262 domain-containing protein [Candidatus Bathyarchaeota archaeon]|nr:DUF262 domain-containing protein [Candidatus Bathyarchaeota archaeon]